MHWRQITNSTVRRYRLNRDYSKTFEQSLRRTLSKDERAVIYPLERARFRGIPGRFIILDTPDFDARPILTEYFAWLDGGADSIIVTPTKAGATTRSVRNFSWRRPNNVRSHTFRKALLLDTHTQKQRKISDLLQVIAGGINISPGTLIVIHASVSLRSRIPPAYAPPGPPPELGVIAIEATTEHVTVLSFEPDAKFKLISQSPPHSAKTPRRIQR